VFVKFGIGFANSGPFAQPGVFETLVRTSDEVGFESLWMVEHVVVPVGYESQYPYNRSGRMPGPEGSPISDPLIALGFAAALSRNLRLATGIIILPQRHPFYVAKEFATLDVLSGGRALMGVGIGWLEEEFEAMGVPFRERAARTEESVRAIRSLWQPEPESFEGEFYRWNPVHSLPKPVQQPGVPVVVGGHVPGAARRAARIGDGFFPAKGGIEALPELVAAIRDECQALGRDPSEIELTASLGKPDSDLIRRFEDIGVSRLVIAPPGFESEDLKRGLGAFADGVIAKH
jgi:probable F420-dependent oxidoreductase